MNVTGDSTDVSTYFKLRKTADGLEATGLTITDLDLQYVRSGVAPTAKVDATALAATDSTHSDNKAIEIDSTDQPGIYRVDWPDAAFAAGVKEVILTVKHASCFTEDLRVLIDAPVNATKWNSLTTVALPLAPTTAGRTLDVSAGGEAGVDWANVGSPTTTVGLSGTTVKTATDVETDTADIQARLPAALTANGNMKSSLMEIIATALTETSGLLAAGFKKFFNVATPTGTVNSLPDAVPGAAGGVFIAGSNAATTANITGNLTGNVSGSVGSVTGNVGGNVTGSIGSLATQAKADVNAEVDTAISDAALATAANLATVAGYIDTEVATIVSQTTAASIRTAVGLASANLDTQLADIPTVAEFEARTLVAASYFDPAVDVVANVTTVGSVAGLTASNLDATISSRATPAQVNTEVLDVLNVDTFAQPGQESPAATTTLSKMLAYLYKAWRNKTTQTSSEYALYADDGTTKDQEAAISDDGTTTTKAEVSTGA